MKLFSEIYSTYFNTVARIIDRAIDGELCEKDILNIISEKAFSESMLMILPAIKSEEWLVVNKEFQTPISDYPKMPLTRLQLRWMKSLLSDPRISLFDVDTSGLEDVEPLFDFNDFVYFDSYSDSDSYTDESYIANFKTILSGLKNKKRIHIQYSNRRGDVLEGEYIPNKLEYSSKDDKFRLEVFGDKFLSYINLGRIQKCELLDSDNEDDKPTMSKSERTVTFTLFDRRNALDRVMINFSDYRKETIRLDNDHYEVKLCYDILDETEVLIRILSFGPMLKVIKPNSFIKLIKNRLLMQKELNSEGCEFKK